MQIARMLQAVVIMLIVVLAASCTASKQYTNKLFAPRNLSNKDSQAVTIKFLEIETSYDDSLGFVNTNDNSGKDIDSTLLTFEKKSSAQVIKTDSIQKLKDEKDIEIQTKPIAINNKIGEIRKKRVRE